MASTTEKIYIVHLSFTLGRGVRQREKEKEGAKEGERVGERERGKD